MPAVCEGFRFGKHSLYSLSPYFPIIFLFPSRVNSSSTIVVHERIHEPSIHCTTVLEPFFLGPFSISLAVLDSIPCHSTIRPVGASASTTISRILLLVNDHNSPLMQFRPSRIEDVREEKRFDKNWFAAIESYQESSLHLALSVCVRFSFVRFPVGQGLLRTEYSFLVSTVNLFFTSRQEIHPAEFLSIGAHV